jgi:ATP-dependent DNA helicase RecQ
MLVRIFTLKFHTATEQFDDGTLQDFIKDKEVLSIREHFFIKHETPYLALIITYLPGSLEGTAYRKKKEDWRGLLSNAQLPLFNALRDWRTERAKQDGVPPYVICTNQHFVEMVTNRLDSLAGLSKIRGFGKAKAEKYGKEILAVLTTKQKIPQKSEQTPEQGERDQQQAMFQDKPGQTTVIKQKGKQRKEGS